MSTSTKEEYYRLNNYDPPPPAHLKGTQKAVETEENPYVWQGAAMCIGRTGEDSPFYPHESERKDQKLEREQRAKEICGQCAVQQECLNYALVNRERYGIWGATTETERKVILGIKRNRSK
jgi:WhiB family redox-sensing transcriptional regulator